MATLADLRVGARAVIDSFIPESHDAHVQRMLALGLTPGTEVEVIRKAPLGDPVIISVCDYQLALRKAQTCLVRCTDCPVLAAVDSPAGASNDSVG